MKQSIVSLCILVSLFNDTLRFTMLYLVSIFNWTFTYQVENSPVLSAFLFCNFLFLILEILTIILLIWNHVPYMRHYSRGLYIFTPFFNAVYIVEWLILQTIYVVNKEILQFLIARLARSDPRNHFSVGNVCFHLLNFSVFHHVFISSLDMFKNHINSYHIEFKQV